jgi:hypothetical protein
MIYPRQNRILTSNVCWVRLSDNADDLQACGCLSSESGISNARFGSGLLLVTSG